MKYHWNGKETLQLFLIYHTMYVGHDVGNVYFSLVLFLKTCASAHSSLPVLMYTTEIGCQGFRVSTYTSKDV
jgi:hypothetical protein